MAQLLEGASGVRRCRTGRRGSGHRREDAWRDNVFVGRLWQTVEYVEVYLRADGSVSEARASIGRYLSFYNGTGPHSSHGGQTPDQACFTQPTQIPAAA